MNLIHTATLMAFLISLVAGCSTQYPHEPLRHIQFGALFLICLVVFVWLLLILKNTKTDKPKPRDGYQTYWMGRTDTKHHIHAVRGTIDEVVGWVERRPLNGDVLCLEGGWAEVKFGMFVMTDVKWDDEDGMKFTATITPWEEE